MSRILVVDDEPALRAWAGRVLTTNGYDCDVAEDAGRAREVISAEEHDLMLLDVNMPGESGMDLLEDVRIRHPLTGVLMVSAQDSVPLAMHAIELGAYGYLIKPVAAGELLINVANALNRRRRDRDTARALDAMRLTVEERSERLAQALQDLSLSENRVRASQSETILRITRMIGFRDEETGQHVNRMSGICGIIAHAAGLGAERAEQIRLASRLHDVGKVSVPDAILLKAGKLTPEEYEVIKGHAEAGYKMLAGSDQDVVRLAATIARSHHERWDGGGYPLGLAGEKIPLEGRIAGIADVFDALTSDRVYRPALPVRGAIDMMSGERGEHFDPELLDVFLAQMPRVQKLRAAHAD